MFNPHTIHPTSRREFLAKAGLGFGGLALAAMMAEEEARGETPEIDPLRPVARRAPHHAAKAKAASSCSWKAGRAISTCSTPSPS